jgi:hypothetical protein
MSQRRETSQRAATIKTLGFLTVQVSFLNEAPLTTSVLFHAKCRFIKQILGTF